MKKTQKRAKRHYPEDFKQQAIDLAREIGTKEAAEKLGIENAFAESFFGTMKNELEFNYFENLDEAKREIFRYISWYNRERIHSSLGYVNPVEYRIKTCLAA